MPSRRTATKAVVVHYLLRYAVSQLFGLRWAPEHNGSSLRDDTPESGQKGNGSVTRCHCRVCECHGATSVCTLDMVAFRFGVITSASLVLLNFSGLRIFLFYSIQVRSLPMNSQLYVYSYVYVQRGWTICWLRNSALVYF
ncbi:hypothetical protein HDV62DRAFT_281609 [Trichoderma sp. SZMC 28011]